MTIGWEYRRGWIERFGILIAMFITRGYYLQYSNSLGDKESIIDSTFIPCPCLGKVGIDQNRKVSLIHWVLDADWTGWMGEAGKRVLV